MSMLKLHRFVLVLAASVMLLAAPARANTPPEFVTELGNRALSTLAETGSPADRERNFRELLHEGFDVEGIARFVLGRYWRAASEAERREYVTLFEDYVVQAYTVRLNEYRGETFKVTGSRPEDDNTTLVTTDIIRPGGAPPVKVDWKVTRAGNAFKIVDVIVEGVSMAVTQRQEFASVIQRNGGQVEGLLKLLRERTGK